MSLRALLLVLGAAIIAGVYIFGVIRRRRERKATYGRTFTRMEIPDAILRHDGEDAEEPAVETSHADGNSGRAAPLPAGFTSEEAFEPVSEAGRIETAQIEAGPEPVAARPETEPATAGFSLPISHERPEELPSVRNDALLEDEPENTRKSSDQLDLFGAESPAPETTSTPRRTSAATKAPPADDDGLLKLFVRTADDKPFGGPELVRAFNAVGMRHGDMSIFHHFGAGDLSCEAPLFSAANLFEPGTFDLDRIEAFRTTGFVLFMQLPAELDGPVAFELMLSAAQRLTELLGGQLYVTPRAVLDPEAVSTLRSRAAAFAARD